MDVTNPTHLGEGQEDLNLVLEWTTDQVSDYLKKAENLVRVITEFYRGLKEGTVQNMNLYEKRFQDIEEQVTVLKDLSRSTFTAEMEKQRLKFQEILTKDVLETLQKGLTPFSNISDLLQEYKQAGQGFASIHDYITSKYSKEEAEKFKEYSKSVDAFAEELGLIAKDSGESFIDKLLNMEDVEKMSEKMAEFLNKAKEHAQKAVRSQFRVAEQNILLEQQRSVYDGISSLITQMTKIENMEKSWLKHLYLMKDVSFVLKHAFYDMLNPLNVGLNIMKMTLNAQKEMIFNLDKMFAGYARAGGILDRDRGMMTGAVKGVVMEGLGVEKVSEAGAAFHTTYRQFSALSETVKKDLTIISAKMMQIGISANEYAQNLNLMTYAFGMSAKQATKVIIETIEYGNRLGFAAKEMTSMMTKALDSLAYYGDRSIRVFKELSEKVKETGVGMDVFLSLEQRFMTFQNTAELAAKINSIAGGQIVDPIRLMMATGKEKQEMLIQAVRSVNLSGNDPRGMMYIAQALQVSPAQLQQLINQSTENVKKTGGTDFDKMVRDSIELLDKFKSLLKSTAVYVGPIVTGLRYIVDLLVEFNKKTHGIFALVVFGIPTVLMSLKILGKMLGFVYGKGSLVGKLFGLLFGRFKKTADAAESVAKNAETAGNALANQGKNISDMGKNAASASSGMQKFGGVMRGLAKGAGGILALGAALLLVSAGVALLANSFKSFNQVLGTVIMFSVAVGGLILSGILLAKVAPLLVVGAGGIIALGVGLISVSAAMLIMSYALKNMKEFGGYLQIIKGLSAIAASVLAAGMIALLAIPFVPSFLLVMTSVAGVLFTFSKLPANIKDIVKNIGSSMKSVISLVSDIVGDLIGIGFKATLSFGRFGKGLSIMKDVLYAFVDAFTMIEGKKISDMVRFFEIVMKFESLESSIKRATNSVYGLVASLKLLKAVELSKINDEFVQFIYNMNPVSALFSSVSGISKESVENVNNITEKISKISETVNNTKENSTIEKILSFASQTIEQAKPVDTGSKNIVIRVELEGRQIAEAIYPYIENNLFPRSAM